MDTVDSLDLGTRSNEEKAYSPPSVSSSDTSERTVVQDDLSGEKCITADLHDGDYREKTIRCRPTIKLSGPNVDSEGKFHLRTRPTTCSIRIGSTESNPVNALLDSCSGMSIMSTKTFNEFFDGEPGQKVKLGVKGIGKQKAVGHICATIFIQSEDDSLMELDVEFHIMDDFDLDVCIGIDAMNNFGINLLTTEKKAHVPSVDKKFKTEFMRLPFQDRLFPIKAKERTRVKKDCQKNVELDVSLPLGRDFMFEPVLLSRPGHGFMKCPNSLISSDTRFLPISNFSSVTESVSKGQVLGFARVISDSAAVSGSC